MYLVPLIKGTVSTSQDEQQAVSFTFTRRICRHWIYSLELFTTHVREVTQMKRKDGRAQAVVVLTGGKNRHCNVF